MDACMLRRFSVAAFVLLAVAPAQAQNVYVTADRLLDVRSGALIASPAIIIQDGVITAVGRVEDLRVPSAAHIIELEGVTLLPAPVAASGYAVSAASPLEAIRSATLGAAHGRGEDGQSGVVAPGAIGDLVGVSGDPLADLSLLASPVFVMKAGAVIVGDD